MHSITLQSVTLQWKFKVCNYCRMFFYFSSFLDNEPPTIENCVDPVTFLTTESAGANVSWDEPIIYDNSKNVTVRFLLALAYYYHFVI